jgi:hypothetical protein
MPLSPTLQRPIVIEYQTIILLQQLSSFFVSIRGDQYAPKLYGHIHRVYHNGVDFL